MTREQEEEIFKEYKKKLAKIKDEPDFIELQKLWKEGIND
jgi:hypothetical protein